VQISLYHALILMSILNVTAEFMPGAVCQVLEFKTESDSHRSLSWFCIMFVYPIFMFDLSGYPDSPGHLQVNLKYRLHSGPV